MKAAVRFFVSPDIELDDFRPDDVDDFTYLVQAIVGPADGEGEESVQFIVCTPTALRKRVAAEGLVLGRGLVIVNTLDTRQVLETLERRITAVEGPTWSDVAAGLTRLGFYEFEDLA